MTTEKLKAAPYEFFRLETDTFENDALKAIFAADPGPEEVARVLQARAKTHLDDIGIVGHAAIAQARHDRSGEGIVRFACDLYLSAHYCLSALKKNDVAEVFHESMRLGIAKERMFAMVEFERLANYKAATRKRQSTQSDRASDMLARINEFKWTQIDLAPRSESRAKLKDWLLGPCQRCGKSYSRCYKKICKDRKFAWSVSTFDNTLNEVWDRIPAS